MPVLSDAELKMVAEIVTEMARSRGAAFDGATKGAAFARAALIDPAFKAGSTGPPESGKRHARCRVGNRGEI